MVAEALFEIKQILVLGIYSCLLVQDGKSIGPSTTVAQKQGRVQRDQTPQKPSCIASSQPVQTKSTGVSTKPQRLHNFNLKKSF